MRKCPICGAVLVEIDDFKIEEGGTSGGDRGGSIESQSASFAVAPPYYSEKDVKHYRCSNRNCPYRKDSE